MVVGSFTSSFIVRQAGDFLGMAVAVLALFGAALLGKQHTVVLPALLLLTDYWWNPGFSLRGIRPIGGCTPPMALGAAGGVAFYWNLIISPAPAAPLVS